MINFIKNTLKARAANKSGAEKTLPESIHERFESSTAHTSHLKHPNNEWTSELHITEVFESFRPYSSGDYATKADITLDTINKIPECIERLINQLGSPSPEIKKTSDIIQTNEQKLLAANLKEKLDQYGSDKANNHDYHIVYSQILDTPENIENIFEIGLGTNNEDVVSNMGTQGRPGASLRAFKEYCQNAHLYGADIDTRILFKENRIKTFYIDQKSPSSFQQVLTQVPVGRFDLVIDDGLHSPDANINSLVFGLQIVKERGWIVIEDINPKAINIWKALGALLQKSHDCVIYQASGGFLFAAQRKQHIEAPI